MPPKPGSNKRKAKESLASARRSPRKKKTATPSAASIAMEKMIKKQSTRLNKAYALRGQLKETDPRYGLTVEKNGRKRWKVDPPITEWKDVPLTWSDKDPDVDRNDPDANIARLEERISEGIMPDIFKDKLRGHKKEKERRERIMASEPEGLPWKVCDRLDRLKGLVEHMMNQEFDNPRLPNVLAIMAAYRSRELDYEEGMATYWYEGRKVAGPVPWDIYECMAISDQYAAKNRLAFTVEGMTPANPIMMPSMAIPGNGADRYHNLINVTLAPPNGTGHTEFEVMDDTGATCMRLFEQDVWKLEQHGGDWYPVGEGDLITANGQIWVLFGVALVNIFSAPGGPTMVQEWFPIQYSISPGAVEDIPGDRRLGGAWLRRLIYSATAPDDSGMLYLDSHKTPMMNSLPVLDPHMRTQPPMRHLEPLNTYTMGVMSPRRP
ncbi:hypothetical protein NUU61_005475 [Penicillium alfredii]|uniref:Uncharacterized protein n=1 Tax=Penicillium alfredii TaxID=1506179 RepID=A0A9W9K7M4_9EURO|nr:uncharacterized protein NUU61_005475 [Penicillium alfredii]KAJ5096119.1 hypothetical protein NUU61_005475 [Penicillium alfredii]